MTPGDYRSLPADLPAPVDDGAADHLPGLELPGWLPRLGLLVAFVYPVFPPDRNAAEVAAWLWGAT